MYTPQRWLQLIRDAQYVVTDSFHGTAFSTLFHRNLFTVLDGNPEDGFNVRMSDFLKRIGLEQRLFNGVPDRIDCADVDYTQADILMKEQIMLSLDYLGEQLQEAYASGKKTESR